MTVSSVPNYKSCWLCDNNVNAVGGLFCSEFDAYCCKDHIINDRTCPVCDCEGINTPHHIIEWVVDAESINDAEIPHFDIPCAYNVHVNHFNMYNDEEVMS